MPSQTAHLCTPVVVADLFTVARCSSCPPAGVAESSMLQVGAWFWAAPMVKSLITERERELEQLGSDVSSLKPTRETNPLL